MVIGNGFFTETEDEAIKDMKKIAKCDVKRCVYQTIGNSIYYISLKGDVFGIQKIGGRYITRTLSHTKRKKYIVVRLSARDKEEYIPLHILTYCTFELGYYDENINIVPVDGNFFNVAPDNYKENCNILSEKAIYRLYSRAKLYKDSFNKVVKTVSFLCNIEESDAKDIAQDTFLYLCIDGYRDKQEENYDFTGLWIHVGFKRGLDYIRRKERLQYETENLKNNAIYPTENIMQKIKGEKAQRYLRMYFEGESATNISKEENTTRSNVACSITRSIQFLKKYYKKDIEEFNK